MGAQKDFLIFCQNNRHLTERTARQAYNADDRPTIDASDGHELEWNEIEALTGGALGKFSLPCPYCGPAKIYSKRFSIWRRQYSLATYHCFYCGQSGAVSADGPLDPVKVAAARKAAKQHDAERAAERAAQAVRWWDEAISLKGIDTAQEYFAARKIELPPNADEVLRWHPRCPFDHDKGPLILALFRDAVTNQPRAIHRTRILNAKRGLARRMSLGPREGCAIKLWPLDGDQLFITEGIENALAAAAMTYDGRPATPIWAATVANNLPTIAPVPGINRLIILGDNDPVGEMNSQELAWRWRSAGREVHWHSVKKQGMDWNDLVKDKK
jgi:hypothetical protein